MAYTPTQNDRAFMDMIGMSEGTVTNPATKARGFDVIVTGLGGVPEVFTDFSRHPFASGRPPKVINSHGLESTASGKSQILLHWWTAYQAIFHWPDFSPASQDLYTLQQLRERHALEALADNAFYDALGCVSGLWASLPGKAYVGQGQHTLVQCMKWFIAAGGTIAQPAPLVPLPAAHPNPQPFALPTTQLALPGLSDANS